ncbi:cation:proton antiporter [Arthrobacter sp. RIT-PI-e]|uniref:monovalent cation/H+ antiporter subunit D family protein n=1 Tax=Arthrobacter sp. RIT-PI-e TaxID=1681197 RepID=UPI000675F3A6|nr:monovalent cation/H+ antiporter subunit D family protein [Arthrobacter sp. RIT-PI-e]KNC18846.1 cation:proton antiporter [Arthrobacter sp. RIT-PI-e]
MNALIGALLPLYVAVPLVIVALLIVLRGHTVLRHLLTLGTLLGMLAGSVGLVIATAQSGVIAHRIALWPNGISIPFVVDTLSALMMTTASLLMLVCLHFAIATREARGHFFSPFMLVLGTGVCGALMTADLFNLFVFIEVMLLPSYGLLIMMSNRRSINGGRLYVTVNLLASTMFLTGTGLVYAVTGTVNLAELAGAAQESTTVAIAVGIVLCALAVKAAVFPAHGWLTRTYTFTSPAVTALFSGLHTKVAVYAIYRIYAVVFDGDNTFLWVALLITSLTMVVGVFGAMGESTMRSVLVFHMVSQIGYILLGVGLFTTLGLTAGIFYLLHNMVVKGSLLLSTGAIEETYGTGDLNRLGGLAKREPLIAVAFMVSALSMAGLPPFSGFVAKLALITAAVDDGAMVVAVVALVVSLFTVLSMLKIWNGVFNGTEPEDLERNAIDYSSGLQHPLAEDPDHPEAVTAVRGITRDRIRIPLNLALPSITLACITLVLGLGSQLLLGLSEQAALGLLDTSSYVRAVLEP